MDEDEEMAELRAQEARRVALTNIEATSLLHLKDFGI
jgi:hypothetical protein